MYSYNQLLTEWENNVDLFFAWLTEVCGISRDHTTYKELQRQIKSVDDISDWVDFFDGNFDNVLNTSEQYIKWKKKIVASA